MIIGFREVNSPEATVVVNGQSKTYEWPYKIWRAWKRWCFEQWARKNATIGFFQGGVAYKFEGVT